jgi:hypothetical protein
MSLETPNDPLPTHPEVLIWRFWLTNLLGWTEAEVMAFAERWRDWLLDENSYYYHEESEYYISWEIVPEKICDSYPEKRVQIGWVMYPILVKYRKNYGLTTEHLDGLREELKNAIEMRLLELTTEKPQSTVAKLLSGFKEFLRDIGRQSFSRWD